MKSENAKKGLLECLTGSKNNKKSPCRCCIEIEEIPDENGNEEAEKNFKTDEDKENR